MRANAIVKNISTRHHNLTDYDGEYRSFSLENAAGRLTRLTSDRINMAFEMVDRHADGERAQHCAIRFVGRGGAREFTFARLRVQANRFANALESLDVERGVRVAVLCGRIPEHYFAALGTLKAGGVYVPMRSDLKSEALYAQLKISSVRVLVTTDRLYQREVMALRTRLLELQHVLLAREGTDDLPPDTQDLSTLLAEASDRFTTVSMRLEDVALLHFADCPRGKARAVLHAHAAVIAQEVTGRIALDLQDDDIYWCSADFGGIVGTSYGIVAPLVCGVSMIVDEAEFDASRCRSMLANEGVTVWCAEPSIFRQLANAEMKEGQRHTFPDLRFLASVGEPLNPETATFGMRTFKTAIHDQWCQIETGTIVIANYAAMNVRPGSIGKPMPGVEAAIVTVRDGAVNVLGADEVGELALKRGWPSMFRSYLNNTGCYQKSFAADWYLTGNRARRDVDGYYWLLGRIDD